MEFKENEAITPVYKFSKFLTATAIFFKNKIAVCKFKNNILNMEI